eukprot:CAMPEP_0174362844 /NCGR_PEP_ID=MMETSP0811_2-20130205/66442_1 /TAXON_ID=73025 ORGANISM="Eutreptiella gymnastica-like, Strain CCMP1594" /NCGR_SAMPLE_ID=MMETSP0811_2 /ASSEMBLY_ACC=CAM_ASM_000667 /LENGTH=92 /DNA_ID=CAMNT_0015500979 /DNA_START=756 /DNA_END=1034 /DNA_ORIENTATION=-
MLLDQAQCDGSEPWSFLDGGCWERGATDGLTNGRAVGLPPTAFDWPLTAMQPPLVGVQSNFDEQFLGPAFFITRTRATSLPEFPKFRLKLWN